MKCLTVCQPWAWAILYGPKRIENRTWATSYRGPLAIHAGKSRDWLCPILNDGTPVPEEALMFGAILGTVELVDCVWTRDYTGSDPFAEGPCLWMLRNPRPLPRPIVYRGQQGLFDVSDKILSLA